jgi:hypothetical protein
LELVRYQRVIAALAGSAGDPSLICVSANLTRSAVNPAEQVGKQIGGGVGWRAAGDSAGISSGATGGGECSGALAQAVSSRASSVSVSQCGSGGEIGGIDDLLLGDVDLCFGGPGGFGRQSGLLFDVCAVCCEVGAEIIDLMCAPASYSQRKDQQEKQCRHEESADHG